MRSFADSDGDGIGDLPGIRSRLPYLRELGVDGLWLTPFYPSPGADHGYDVANYVDVDPQHGTLADFDALLADAHALGLKVLVDIVPNHTSNEHPWFVNALSSPDHPDRARYVFRPGRDGGPPNGWTSVFGGPAWTCDEASGEWYLHLFAPEQPDLDWHVDAVPKAFEEILRFWFDRGVDGFRIDVAQALFKAQDLHEVVEPENPTPFADWHTALQQPELHGLYRRWRELAGGYDGERGLRRRDLARGRGRARPLRATRRAQPRVQLRVPPRTLGGGRAPRRRRPGLRGLRRGRARHRPGCSRTTTSLASRHAAATGPTGCGERERRSS